MCVARYVMSEVGWWVQSRGLSLCPMPDLASPGESNWAQVSPSASSESRCVQVKPSEPKWNQVKINDHKWNSVTPSGSSKLKWGQVIPSEPKWDPSEPGKDQAKQSETKRFERPNQMRAISTHTPTSYPAFQSEADTDGFIEVRSCIAPPRRDNRDICMMYLLMCLCMYL